MAVTNCGHLRNEDIVVPYPTEDGQGVGLSASAIADVDDWVLRIKHRCCNGSCRYETFSFARQMTVDQYMRPTAKGLFFDCVKTAFRPYDVAVTAVLLIAKRYLHDELIIHSGGAETQWADAKRICQQVLGYGDWFGIVEQEIDASYEDSNGILHTRQAVILELIEIRPGSLLPLE
jgi:hypothetical protein